MFGRCTPFHLGSPTIFGSIYTIPILHTDIRNVIYMGAARAEEPANFLAAPAPDFFFQAAPTPDFFPKWLLLRLLFFRAAPAPRG